MSDQPKNLSEISHLFLSSVRGKAQGSARPSRTPPAARAEATIDLTAEELAQVFGENGREDDSTPPIGPVRAILSSHLGPQQLSRVREYAAHVCPQGGRIGLIAVDASEFRLSVFEHNPHPQAHPDESHGSEMLDPRRMSQALDELAWDVDRWLLLLPSPRAPEARSLLRDVADWTVLSNCDHEGIVACYRTLKGLSDLNRPRLALVTVDSPSDVEAMNAYQRLATVCRQFLDWPMENESPLAPASGVTEHVVLWCSGTRDKAQLATAPQWQVVSEFLAKAKKTPVAPQRAAEPAPAPVAPQPSAVAMPAPAQPMPTLSAMPQNIASDIPEVLDLPDAQDTPAGILSAVMRGGHELVECPVKPPMYGEASLAVSRERRLVLLAVPRQGLNDLHQIGRAYQWLIENRSLIAMAVPQMSIDAHQHPTLYLLVDHSDMSAQILQPILQSANVKVHAYRKLRWGGKTGLLVEAA